VSEAALEESDAGGTQSRLGGVEEISVGSAEQRGEGTRKAREPTHGDPDVTHPIVSHRRPHSLAVPRPHHLDRRDGCQQLRKEMRAARRIVREVEAEDGDLHAARSVSGGVSVA
jgi:hypothetical protein